jgi:glutamyl-tRNA synthetase
MPVTFYDHFAKQEVAIHLHEAMGDFVIQRKDGLPAYQIATVADDVHFGINTIVRGADLLLSTAAQLYIAALLDLTAFLNIRFWHHPLLTDEQGSKLSKSAGSTALVHLRHQHIPYEKIRATFAQVAPTVF